MADKSTNDVVYEAELVDPSAGFGQGANTNLTAVESNPPCVYFSTGAVIGIALGSLVVGGVLGWTLSRTSGKGKTKALGHKAGRHHHR
jgi:hypothetical protein